jgi:hypothetical protein
MRTCRGCARNGADVEVQNMETLHTDNRHTDRMFIDRTQKHPEEFLHQRQETQRGLFGTGHTKHRNHTGVYSTAGAYIYDSPAQ